MTVSSERPLHIELTADGEPSLPEEGKIGFDVQIWVDAFNCLLLYGATVAALRGAPAVPAGLVETLSSVTKIGENPVRAKLGNAALKANADTRGVQFPTKLRLELTDLATAIAEGTAVLPELTLATALRILRIRFEVPRTTLEWLRSAITCEPGVDYIASLDWDAADRGADDTWALLQQRCPERLEGSGGGVDRVEDGRQANANKMLRNFFAKQGKSYMYATRDTDLAYADPRTSDDATDLSDVVRTIHYEPVDTPKRGAPVHERFEVEVVSWWTYNLPAERTGGLRDFQRRAHNAREAAKAARAGRTIRPSRPTDRRSKTVKHYTGVPRI